MLSLMFCLPHILGSIFQNGDRHYHHFLLLVQICQLCFSPYSDSDTPGELEYLINKFRMEWLNMYPLSRIKPKMHFLTHLVEKIKFLGPLRHLTCLRFEGKQGWFKDMHIHNFKNIVFSLAAKHQFYLCHKLLDINGSSAKNFVYGGNEVGEGQVIRISPLNRTMYNDLCIELGFNECFSIYEAKMTKVNGIKYTCGMVLILDTDSCGFF